jgi:phthalate 4,5-cis-dihydrodiol dehydrogenase
MVYSDEDKREIPISRDTDGRHGIVNHLYEAVVNGRPSFADGRWGKATVEVLLAVLASAQEHREVRLSHQVRLLH